MKHNHSNIILQVRGVFLGKFLVDGIEIPGLQAPVLKCPLYSAFCRVNALFFCHLRTEN